MASITLKGNPVSTVGDLPAVGTAAPEFRLTRTDLSEVTLADLAGKTVILSVFPSVDTPTCATSVRTFNAKAAALPNTVVLCASADLPFAHKRFCGAEGLDAVVSASDLRDKGFGARYGLTIAAGPLEGLLARAVLVIGADGVVRHAQLVSEIADEPDYAAALAAI
ncbi:thiol peroxidase [Insolitispirillum peregrinum]|uniref:Thiol peroxidase n=1 Tax=Insolitispirillum peregrinum TaxID=80876 RepID=A0A1N7LDE1_9PROT|nr:thiol peroxidase [Insolitispirillum peregrinum]SIS71826.1 thiol peroxidase (atypical 2-Cys peroxiredoxin) [Insolitispirillum peregrinum]